MIVRILLFEDNHRLRESLRELMAVHQPLQLVAAYADVTDVTAHIQHHQPHVVLMDIDMPKRNGIEGLRELRHRYPQLPVIMLTVFDDNTHVLEAIKAGASGYLLKKHITTKLFDSIQEVLEGGAPMSPAVARMVIQSFQGSPSADLYGLTPREKEVLASLSQGNSYKMIAAKLVVTVDTIRSHIKHIYEKLHVHSQTEAVSKAINEKLV
ncbi:MAG: response regulator transcription factor [Cyclobacteriaceae bacterium]|jgi:DNA-binding NarL/FixJ family response regulator|nr:response regulator transcription factor [Cyclobacteriaceae bacterium]